MGRELDSRGRSEVARIDRLQDYPCKPKAHCGLRFRGGGIFRVEAATSRGTVMPCSGNSVRIGYTA
jgi:hypothetical protein